MPAGIGGHARLEAHRVGQPGGVDDEQHQVAAAGVERLRRQVHLVRRGQVHEPDRRPGTAAAPRRRRRAARQAAGSMRCTRTSGATLRSWPA